MKDKIDFSKAQQGKFYRDKASFNLPNNIIKNSSFIIIDIEASGLDKDSYPIEIAWLDSEGNKDSFLIKPASTWHYWDEYAEMFIHKISKKQLHQKGISPLEAVNRLNKALTGKTVYSDVVKWDSFWLYQLYTLTNKVMSYTCEDIYYLLPIEEVDAIKIHQELKEIDRPHRALADCINIMQVLRKFLCKAEK